LYVITLKDTHARTRTNAHVRTQLVGLHLTRYRPVAEPDNTQYLQETNILAPAGFESAISLNKRPQTHDLDRAATGIGHKYTVRAKPAVLQLKADGYTLFFPLS